MDFNMVIKPVLNDIKTESMEDFRGVGIPSSSDYDEGVIPNIKNEDSIGDKIMDQIYPIQNHQSESETEDTYDECYSCFMCNVSFNTQFDLDAHLHTHIDDETFHHSNINSISEPLPQSSIKPSKYFRCSECLKICKSQLSYNEHMLTHTGEKPHHCRVEEEKSERDAVQEAIESSRQDIQNMLRKRKQQLTDYNTEEYQKLLETLILEKNSTGQINEAKLIGPLFWKNALVKAGLVEEDILPMQFQSQLRLIECMSCRKCFARLPRSNESNILPSKPPCSSCFMIKNESTLNKHKAENHNETPPYICKECSLESDTWYKYVQHMKMHLRYAAKCSECVYNMMNKPDTVIFLCDVCEMSFDTDDELKVHVQTHLENGQNNDR